MSEEFEESEVIFKDYYEVEDEDRRNMKMKPKESRKKAKTSTIKSMPVNIPENVPWLRCVDADLVGGGGGEMVPPHLIVERRRVATLSVCTGIGRTLKGRDLSEVRNSVLRMTGFLET